MLSRNKIFDDSYILTIIVYYNCELRKVYMRRIWDDNIRFWKSIYMQK